MDVKGEYRTIFCEEAREHLEQWEQALLALERSPNDPELLRELFRAVHTLKGSAGFIGFDDLQRLAHDLESALQEVRDGRLPLSPPLSDALFRGLDLARRMVEAFAQGQSFGGDLDAYLRGLGELVRGGVSEGASPPQPQGSSPGSAAGTAPQPSPPSGAGRVVSALLAISASGREAFLRAYLVRNRLSAVGRVLSEEPPPESMDSSVRGFQYRVTLETDRDQAAVREALNVDQVEILELGEGEGAMVDETAAAGGAETPVAEGLLGRPVRSEEVVRVSVERLDTLLNLVGELVIRNSGFATLAQQLREQRGRDPLVQDLEEKTEALARITRDLQDGIMKVRMLPVRNVFSRFHRVVRDLAKFSGKEVELRVSGEETEIDKKVMDRIGDPLVHLVRNAVDHGIERREERLAAGKSPIGVVSLSAYQDGDRICVEVSDDGRGLDRRSILEKAVATGLVKPEEAEAMSDEQAFSLVFLPGFSTARQVTEISGRGVGMDVVQREVEALGGTVRVRSAAGRGTSITMSLPLTMAIVSAVLVEVADGIFAIPLSSVREVLKVDPATLHTIGGRRTIRLREDLLSLVGLGEALGFDGGEEPKGSEAEGGRIPVVVVDYESRRIGLGVDRVIGTAEIVVKSLSRHFHEVEGLIGASILGNGRIALIVDVETMVGRFHHGAQTAEHGAVVFTTRGELRRPTIEVEAAHQAATRGGPAPPSGQVAAPPEQRQVAVQAEQAPPAEEGLVAGEAAEGTPPGGEEIPASAEAVQETGGPETTTEEQVALAAESRLLEEIHNAGAINASMALGGLLGDEIRVSFPESQIVALADVADSLGGEELPMGAIYVGLTGELTGGVLLVMPAENLCRIHEWLYRQPKGSCAGLDQVDMSGIQEVGNILAGSFVTAMADATGLALRPEAPETSVDMCLAVIDSVLARFNQPGEKLLLTRAVVFSGRLEEVVCHLLLFLEPPSLKRLVDALQQL